MRVICVAAVGLGVTGVALADPCAPLVQRIASQIAAKGITDYSLTVVPIDAQAPGKVVGWCNTRQSKVVLRRDGAVVAARPAPNPVAAPRQRVRIQFPANRQAAQPTTRLRVITECRDGLVIVQGDCPG
jgi:hypothetical protein